MNPEQEKIIVMVQVARQSQYLAFTLIVNYAHLKVKSLMKNDI